MIERGQKLDYALVSSLERDPLLAERLQRLRTVPGVGPIKVLTWALEMGDYTRFQSIKEVTRMLSLLGSRLFNQPEICSGDQSRISLLITIVRSFLCLASRQVLGRRANFQA